MSEPTPFRQGSQYQEIIFCPDGVYLGRVIVGYRLFEILEWVDVETGEIKRGIEAEKAARTFGELNYDVRVAYCVNRKNGMSSKEALEEAVKHPYSW